MILAKHIPVLKLISSLSLWERAGERVRSLTKRCYQDRELRLTT